MCILNQTHGHWLLNNVLHATKYYGFEVSKRHCHSVDGSFNELESIVDDDMVSGYDVKFQN
jgi:hypothetical protein